MKCDTQWLHLAVHMLILSASWSSTFINGSTFVLSAVCSVPDLVNVNH